MAVQPAAGGNVLQPDLLPRLDGRPLGALRQADTVKEHE